MLKALILINLFLSLTVANAGLGRDDDSSQVFQPASRSNCAANKSLGTVSINIGFTYPNNKMLNLHESPINDRKFYTQMASGFTPKTKVTSIGDASVNSQTKEQFLASLKSIVGNAGNVNFNYSGHGIQLANGEFALVLPSIPEDVLKQCAKRDGSNSRSIVEIDADGHVISGNGLASPNKIESAEAHVARCSALQKYFVSAKDLKTVFGDRKVFGIIDACHAGAFDLGANSSMLLSSKAEELSGQDEHAGGNFTLAIKQKLESTCNSDLDGDQQVSMHELAAVIDPSGSAFSVASRGLGRTDGGIGAHEGVHIPFQHPLINDRSWMDCFVPSVPSAQKCTRSFHSGQRVETTAPADAINNESHGQVCSLPPGTHLEVLQNVSATNGRIRVEVPSKCGFSVGSVPIGVLRDDGSLSQPSKVSADPASNGAPGSSSAAP